MFVVRLRNYLHLSFLVIFLLFSSCIDEFYKDTPKEGYITITGINTRAYTGLQVTILRAFSIDTGSISEPTNIHPYSTCPIIG